MSYVIFDVLACDGHSVMANTYAERRSILEGLDLHGAGFCTAETFDDGEALFAAVVEQGLEGIVAKPLSGAYRPGRADWLKINNRASWRFRQERELAQRRRFTSPRF